MKPKSNEAGGRAAARTVLITGGSSGIGAAMVASFTEAGYRVWFTYHSGSDRAQALEARHGATAFALHLGERDSHAELIGRLPGPVDILVNNAGLGSRTVERVSRDPHEQDAAFMSVNAVGALWLVRDLVPAMEARGFGTVLFVSSVGGGIAPFPAFHPADGMSKAALAYLGKHLQARYARAPIDVFTICPGATDTPMFAASTLEGLSAQERAGLLARLPGGRLIEPREVADLAVWLCRAEARLLRGAVLDASLGLGVHPGLITGEG
jgi:NAD(P)-dependent dehydrogenase (short-subunit alcohol dehydrogenase family)